MTIQMQRKYRASSAPLYSTCPAAAHGEDDAVAIKALDDAGTLGSAVHEACAGIVCGLTPKLDEIAADYDLSETQRKDLAVLTAIAAKFWREHGQAFQKEDGVARVLDWKTTRLECVDYRAQMTEYGDLAFSDPGLGGGLSVEQELSASDATGHADVIWAPEHVTGYQYIIVFLRDLSWEVSRVFTMAELCAGHKDYVARIESWDGKTYCPGGHCQYCPRQAVCPGLVNMLARTHQAISSRELDQVIDAAAPAVCVNLWEQTGLIEKMVAQARQIIKARAAREGGSLRGDGKALILKERIEKQIVVEKAWSTLMVHFTPQDVTPCMTIRKSKTEAGPGILDLVAEGAPRGGKKKAREMLLDELTAAGAVATTIYIAPRIVAALSAAQEKTLEVEDASN